METLTLKLEPGQDLHQSLHQLASDHQLSGFVLGVVGDLSVACFQCPGQPHPTQMQGILEVITLNGTLSPQGVHLHLSLSDGACQVWGGHLEPGTIGHKGVQLLVGLNELPGQSQPTSNERVEWLFSKVVPVPSSAPASRAASDSPSHHRCRLRQHLRSLSETQWAQSVSPDLC